MRRQLLLYLPLSLLLLAMGFGGGVVWADRPTSTAMPTVTPTGTATPSPTPTATATATSTDTPPPTSTPSPTDTPTPAGTPTPSPTPSRTPTITPTPTYDPPDARVEVQANCRYGPGAAYLYEWGLYPTDRVEIFGRNDLGTWVYVDPWTYVDRCWVKTEFLDVFRGDVFDAPPYYGRLPKSDLYSPPIDPSAQREGDRVIINWTPVWMTEDDDRGYLIEAWVCRDRQIIFTPIHVNWPPAYVIDEPGCSRPSSARLYTAEKHGYTQWVLVPWPEHVRTPAAMESPN